MSRNSSMSDSGTSLSSSTFDAPDDSKALEIVEAELGELIESMEFERQFCRLADSYYLHEVDRLSRTVVDTYSSKLQALSTTLEEQLPRLFINMLNAIMSGARRIIPINHRNSFHGLNMFDYNGIPTGDDSFDENSTKLHVIGLLQEPDATIQGAHWRDVHLLYEAKKGHVSPALVQCGVYARAIFAHQCNKWRVYAFVQTNCSTCYFVLYDRSGCTYTPPINFNEAADRTRLARIVLSLLSCSDSAAGFDHSVSVDGSRIRFYGSLYATSLLDRRVTVRGFATQVYRITGTEPVTTEDTIAQDTERVVRPSTPYHPSLMGPVDTSHANQIVKLCWVLIPRESPNNKPMPIEEADREAAFISAMNSIIGSFNRGDFRLTGLPSFGPGEVVQATIEDKEVNLSTIILNPDTQEVREKCGRRIVTCGRPLTSASGPKELCDALKGCIIGKGSITTGADSFIKQYLRAAKCLQTRFRTS